jgi:hypothetical protein
VLLPLEVVEEEVEEVIQHLLVDLEDLLEVHLEMFLLDLHLKEMLVVMVMVQHPVMPMVAVEVVLVVLAVDQVDHLLLVPLVVLELDFQQLSKIQYQHLDQEPLLYLVVV